LPVIMWTDRIVNLILFVWEQKIISLYN